MSSSQLIRWSGLASIVAGVLFILGEIVSPAEINATTVLNSPYATVRTLHVAWMVLGLLGLVGLYARQAEETGWLGLVGFVLAFIGTALLGSLFFVEAYVFPTLATNAPALVSLDPAGPLFAGPLTLVGVVLGVCNLLGYIVFGIATIRAGVLPRWGVLLLIVGVVVGAPGPAVPFLVRAAGTVLFGLGQVWLGYTLWSGTGEIARRPAPAR
jgi:hypothetical protein